MEINGSSIKDKSGRTGRILSVSEQTVSVAWHRKGFAAEMEDVPRTSKQLAEDIQVLTLKDGWVPLARFVGIQEEKMAGVNDVIQELKQISGNSVEEAVGPKKRRKISKHNPFKRYSPIGPGPNVEFGTREVARRRDWRCKKTGPYSQMCVGVSKKTKGRKKPVHIDPGYKQKYNARYKSAD